VIWDNDPKLPWHVAFALLEISSIVYAVTRFRQQKQTWIVSAVSLVVVAAAHVYYAVNLAEEYPYVGPHRLPWHAIFIVCELAAVSWAVVHYIRHRKITSDVLFPLFVVVAGHAFYIIKLAEENPTFELEVRWYGVVFALGLLLAARAMPIYFERWGYPRKHGEELCLWTPVGMLLGAHFVHMIFYETDAILENPIRLFQLGSGLASHGGGLGAILGVVFFALKKGIPAKTMLAYMDPAMCASTWVIPWVRVGNFFNSEIVGAEWHGPWAVTFPRHDCPGYPEVITTCQTAVPRHPSQVYEAILAFIMVGLAVYLERRWRNRLRPGAILFILLGYYFTTRFLVELLKDRQGVDDETFLSMGQMLSIPIVLLCLYMLFVSRLSNIRTTIAGPEVLDNPPPVDLGRAALEAPKEERALPEEDSAEPAPVKRAGPSKKKKKKKG
jgi:phosphatidylglycerol:prolipoprotein diacylglycerol transferase